MANKLDILAKENEILKLKLELLTIKADFPITQRAFDLIVEDIACVVGCMGCPLDSKICDSWRGVEQSCSKAIQNYYIEKAKESIRNEN